MKNLIYYPDFESTDENWIKFALLYVNNLRPIIPLRAESRRSDLYKKLFNETDLISNHRPDFREGHETSLSVISICDMIAKQPDNYFNYFHSMDVTRDWKNKSLHTYTLFEEKFSSEWFQYCLKNGYGKENEDGLEISETLATLYMTVLANKIADDKNISPITDRTDLDDLAFFCRKARR